ncbi:MAG: RraA family protein [Alphaproteobacteria bacterium]|nr:RraA family protein [Alphaproteobacteria bacterium]
MSFVINAMPPQVPARVVEKLSRVETATVGHTRHWGFMDRGIQGVLPGRRAAGTAVTVQIPGQDSAMLHHALGLLRPGDVLVVDRMGDDRHACLGGGVALAAKLAGAVAAVVDGPCTDFSEIRLHDFPVWCRGPSPITTRVYAIGGSLNAVIGCGGVTVNPGDAVVLDESGVLVLPPGEAEDVADAALARQEREKDLWAKLRAGAKIGDLSGATAKIKAAMGKG